MLGWICGASCMCGFVGYFGPVRDAEPLLESMTAAIAHRGPDARGLFVSPEAGLGHARLSIVGLGDGQQPMADETGGLTLAFNGEIFNYVELREQLRARGRRFRTGSDTEVILHLYDEMGDGCLSVLNGDFAFAIWDARRRRMLLARDRMGVRPLFYTQRDGRFYFASEVKALLQVPGVTAELDPVALDQIFTLWAPIAPRTAFRDISELEPASLMIVQDGSVSTRPYWSLDYPDRDAPSRHRDEREAAEELRALLTEATRIRMRADVPVGAYLSGGLDSSITSALAVGIAPAGLKTFSVTFDSAEHDESAFQLEMARALGTDPKLILLDEPTAGMNPVETHELGAQILRLNAEGITVLVIEHDMSLIRQVCEQIYVLNFGQIIAHGTYDALRGDPRVIEAYLGKEDESGAA